MKSATILAVLASIGSVAASPLPSASVRRGIEPKPAAEGAVSPRALLERSPAGHPEKFPLPTEEIDSSKSPKITREHGKSAVTAHEPRLRERPKSLRIGLKREPGESTKAWAARVQCRLNERSGCHAVQQQPPTLSWEHEPAEHVLPKEKKEQWLGLGCDVLKEFNCRQGKIMGLPHGHSNDLDPGHAGKGDHIRIETEKFKDLRVWGNRHYGAKVVLPGGHEQWMVRPLGPGTHRVLPENPIEATPPADTKGMQKPSSSESQRHKRVRFNPDPEIQTFEPETTTHGPDHVE